MAGRRNRVTAPELEQFVVDNVQLTGETPGAGAYGSVEEVEIPGARVAAKKLHSQLINLGSPQQVQKWVTDFVEECKLMSQLRHPHIVQFLGVCYLPGSPIPILLMEKLQTSLDSLLETTPNISLDVKVHLLTGTARGLVYLHSHTPPIAHRDLTARNILVDSGLTAKIADLGVARMVTIQPGQLAATMTAGPGNNLYMPPETVQEEGTTQYNTAIDTFSFGVVSLFTLTQTFPKDLKPSTYRDPITRRVLGRTEIERREHYIQPIQAALGETHPLVKLTLDCLEYDPEDRPSGVEVLRRLEEIRRAVPQNCAETKLELIQLCHRQLREKDAQIAHLQAEKTEKQELVSGLEVQLEDKCREIERLSGHLRSLKLQPQVEGSQGSRQSVMPMASAKSPTVPSSITFNWRTCSDIPEDISVYGQPVALNGKLYVSGKSDTLLDSVQDSVLYTVFMYTPESDQWAWLRSPPVEGFTIATLRGQLLVVGGRDKSTNKTTNTIHTFNEPRHWLQSHPAMPTAVTSPAVIAYQDHLIVAGGLDSSFHHMPDVNILNTVSKKWKIAQPLPSTDDFSFYQSVLIQDTVYLVGTYMTGTVLRAHVPTLISGAMSGVWETLANAPHYSSPITIGNTLLTVGPSIQMYNPTTNQWTTVSDPSEPIYSRPCTVLSGKLFVLGGIEDDRSVYIATSELQY